MLRGCGRRDRPLRGTIFDLSRLSSASGEYVRSTTDFYAAPEAEGFTRQRTRTGNIINGLRLKTHADPKDEFSDFLS